MLEKNSTFACFPLVSECQQHCNRGTVSRCSNTTITNQSVEQNYIFAINIFLTRRQSMSLTEVPSIPFEEWLKYMWLNLSDLQHVRLNLSMHDFHVKIIVIFFCAAVESITLPLRHRRRTTCLREKKEKKTANASLLSFLLDSPFSSPFHSRRALSIIKGTCGTNPCKSPVLSVLYLRATQASEILHLHA